MPYVDDPKITKPDMIFGSITELSICVKGSLVTDFAELIR